MKRRNNKPKTLEILARGNGLSIKGCLDVPKVAIYSDLIGKFRDYFSIYRLEVPNSPPEAVGEEVGGKFYWKDKEMLEVLVRYEEPLSKQIGTERAAGETPEDATHTHQIFYAEFRKYDVPSIDTRNSFVNWCRRRK